MGRQEYKQYGFTKEGTDVELWLSPYLDYPLYYAVYLSVGDDEAVKIGEVDDTFCLAKVRPDGSDDQEFADRTSGDTNFLDDAVAWCEEDAGGTVSVRPDGDTDYRCTADDGTVYYLGGYIASGGRRFAGDVNGRHVNYEGDVADGFASFDEAAKFFFDEAMKSLDAAGV